MIVNRPLLVHTWDGVGGVFTGIMSFHVEKRSLGNSCGWTLHLEGIV